MERLKPFSTKTHKNGNNMSAENRRNIGGRRIAIRFAAPLRFAVHFHRRIHTQLNMNPIKSLQTLGLTALFTMTALITEARAETKHSQDIVAVASSAGSFNTLVAAVKAAGLVETLQGAGPFTVFAPTDEAFAKLPKGTVEDLLKPENKAKLAGILTYHVVPGKVMAADVRTMKAKTVNGQELDIKVGSSGVMINKAKVVKTDVPASNGVIHVIDTVVLPK